MTAVALMVGQALVVTIAFYIISIGAVAIGAVAVGALIVQLTLYPIFVAIRWLVRLLAAPPQRSSVDLIRRSDLERARAVARGISRSANQAIEQMHRHAERDGGW